MDYKFISYQQDNHISTITICRPEVLNAVHPPANIELEHAWARFRDDEDSWVAILTGQGQRAFSAGNDLRYAAEIKKYPVDAFPSSKGGFGGITADFHCPKPMIAAVNGHALGGGLEMALACDIIICSETAKLGLPEPRVGLTAAAGGMHRLPRHIPLKIAMGYMLTAHHMTPAEAYRFGLVNEITPSHAALETAYRWAEEILKNAPLSVRATKESAYGGLDLPLNAAIHNKFHQQRLSEESRDSIEGPLAFAEKRKPNWQSI